MGCRCLRTPNLNALRMFDAAARRLNFRLAAEELNLTQGAVAQQIRRLEAELGLQLFHRRPRGLALTDLGRRYHGPVRRALSIIEDATRDIHPRIGRVTISVTPSFAAKWLVPRLGRFTEAHPDIDLQIMASDGLADFRFDGVDLAIRQGAPPFDGDLHVELLAPLNLCAVSSPAFAAIAGPIRRIEDFAAQPLLQDAHRLWDRLFDEAGITARPRMMQFNQTALAMDAAVSGRGVALVPGILLDAEIAGNDLVELWRDNGPSQGGYYIVYPKGRDRDPEGRAVIAWMRREIGHTRAAPR